MTNGLNVRSILHPKDRMKAVEALASGEIIAVQVMTVFGLFADASNAQAIQALLQVKGKPSGTKFASMLPPHLIAANVDTSQLAAPFQTTVPDEAALCRHYRIPHFLQIPVRNDTEIPRSLVTDGGSQSPDTVLCMWFPSYPPINLFLEAAFGRGMVLASTSLNHRHLASVVYEQDAIDYCTPRPAVNWLFSDPYATGHIVPNWSGSYSILSTLPAEDGCQDVLRCGNLSCATLARMYGCSVSQAHRILDGCHTLDLPAGIIDPLLKADIIPIPRMLGRLFGS